MQKPQARKYRSAKQTGAFGLMKLAPLIGVVIVIYPFAACFSFSFLKARAETSFCIKLPHG
jgi:hypothetical protein